MLTLSRQEGESIYIGDDIRVVVVRSGSRVRIGIEAPDDVLILREELKEPACPSPS